MAVLSTFCEPSLWHHVHRELWRSVLLDVTPIISATACHQRNYVERYSRFTVCCLQYQRLSQKKVPAIERYVRGRHGWEGLAIYADVSGMRINRNVRIGLIVEHMPLAHATGARDREGTAAPLQPLAVVASGRRRRNEIDAETGSSESVPPPVGSVDKWLALPNGGICLPDGPPRGI